LTIIQIYYKNSTVNFAEPCNKYIKWRNILGTVTNWVLGLGDLGTKSVGAPSNPPPNNPPPFVPPVQNPPPFIPYNTGGPIGAAVYYTAPITTTQVGQANYNAVPNSPVTSMPTHSPHVSNLGTHPQFTTPTSVWYGIGNSSGTLPTSYPGQAAPSPIIGKQA